MAENQVELVKQKTDIVSLIDERVKLKKAGRNFKALCPFHGEKTPSFFVSPELQTYKCFGCSEGGDVYSFLQAYEGMTFPEALEYLAKKAGVKLVRDYRSGDERKKERLYEVLHLTEEYYYYLLTSHKVGRKALGYLKGRGLSPTLIKTFGLGYAADDWDGLIRYLVGKKKYEIEELLAVGLVIKSARRRRRDNKNNYYDRFRGRVMFPLRNMRGRTLGFSGRKLPGGDEDEEVAKYINTPETKLYRKRELLYGLSVARSAIKRKDRVVVVEGETDMISSFRSGVKEVVAIKGSALTEEQVELLRRLTNNVVLALDADAAGSKATKRGIEIVDKAGMNMSVVEVTEGKDPDGLVRKDPKAWRKLTKKTISVYDYLISKAFEEFDSKTGEGKRRITRELAPLVAKISNAVEQEHYMKEVARKLGVSQQVVQEEVIKAERLPAAETAKDKEEIESTEVKSGEMRREKIERYLVSLFLQLDSDLAEKVEVVDVKDIADPSMVSLWKNIKKEAAKEGATIKKIVQALPKEQQRLVEALFTPEVVGLSEEKLIKIFIKGAKELKRLARRERLEVIGKEIASLEAKESLSGGEQTELKSLQVEFSQVSGELKKDR